VDIDLAIRRAQISTETEPVMKQAIIFGAGNIGRGFIGQLFHESGYSLTLVDVDQALLEALNTRKSYSIRLVDNESEQQVEVGPLQALHSGDRSAVVEAVRQARLGATAVGARILPFIAPLVAEGMEQRRQDGNEQPLNLIICENLKNAAAVFRGQIYEHLDEAGKAYASRCLGLVDTVIGRMVPPPTPEMRQSDPGLILVEPYKELPVDRSGFLGEIPQVTAMEPCDNFPAYTARKLYIHNCGHACLAYLGYLKGYEYGYEALADPGIFERVRQALDESKAGIVAHYGVQDAWLEAHIRDLLRRFSNRALGDTVFRLGRDPLRKLAPDDRLVAPARLAEKAGIEPKALALAIAAALRFAPPEDPIAMELQNRIQKESLAGVLESACGIRAAEPLGRLVQQAYANL
jgi:mannitol-1-phosphate 5-dehydrogenase